MAKKDRTVAVPTLAEVAEAAALFHDSTQILLESIRHQVLAGCGPNELLIAPQYLMSLERLRGMWQVMQWVIGDPAAAEAMRQAVANLKAEMQRFTAKQ